MATRNVSPGGTLLRASRMFAIPAPLTRPAADLASTVIFKSDTATQPHPLQLSITTPSSSLATGDWGLKRPLPLRSTTKSSTPLIRVKAMDSWEHVTEFASAADHTLTLQKWQEMNLPLSTPVHKERRRGETWAMPMAGRGVFENDTDVTTVDKAASEDNRWRFGGPWLAGQTEGEFNAYVTKQVNKRKPEFIEFLRTIKAAEDTKIAQRRATENGTEVPATLSPAGITNDQMMTYLKELRQDRGLLFKYIRQFLDLAPAPSNSAELDRMIQNDVFNAIGTGEKQITLNAEDYLESSKSPYANTGPPKTHPSAGLSYLRTGSHIYNHPVFGPQANPPPIEGRVVQPKNSSVGTFGPKLGVGGIVVEVPPTQDGFNTRQTSFGQNRAYAQPINQNLLNVNPSTVGGSKIWLKPTSASIDPKGRIIMTVAQAESRAVAVHQGVVNTTTTDERRTIAPARGFSRPLSGSQTYGLSSNSGQSVFANKARATEEGRWGQGASGRGFPRSRVDDDATLKELEGLLSPGSRRPGN